MTKSELIESLAVKNPTLSLEIVDECVREVLDQVALTLEKGERVEIRGFGCFSLHYRRSRVGRNPKTGDSVKLDAKSVPHFKAGKNLKERVDPI